MTTTGQDNAVGDGWTDDNKRWGAGALMFDGVDGYVNAGSDSSLDDLTQKTIMGWINLSSWGGSGAGRVVSYVRYWISSRKKRRKKGHLVSVCRVHRRGYAIGLGLGLNQVFFHILLLPCIFYNFII